MNVQPTIVSSKEYDISYLGLEHIHPFDGRKYGHAWRTLRKDYGLEVCRRTIKPSGEAAEADLGLVHPQKYLDSLHYPVVLARALEMMPLSSLPYRLLRDHLLRPMRLATQGTITAAQVAMRNGMAVNLSGGYHHASADRAEGFCLYADIPIAIEKLRQCDMLRDDQQALIIDLDAHQGNGYARYFYQRDDAFIFDMFNEVIYPNDDFARERIDYQVPLRPGANGDAYMDLLRRKLPEGIGRARQPAVAFYIAGTDVYEKDALGGMKVSEETIYARDRFVLETLAEAGIPTVMVLGGGYCKVSYRMIARTVGYMLERWGDRAQGIQDDADEGAYVASGVQTVDCGA